MGTYIDNHTKRGGGGILHSFKWGSSTSRSNPLILYPFSKPLESSFKISFWAIYQNPLILAHESKWEIINNILELEEGKSLKERFPYAFIIHVNSEIPYPLIVISETWKLLSRASRYMSLHGVLPHTQSRNSWQVAMKLALRLSDQAASSVFEYKLVTLSQLLVWNLLFSGLVKVHRHY